MDLPTVLGISLVPESRRRLQEIDERLHLLRHAGDQGGWVIGSSQPASQPVAGSPALTLVMGLPWPAHQGGDRLDLARAV